MIDERILDYYSRGLNGKKIKENEFDIQILPAKLKELISKYDIKYPPGEAVSHDMDMACRVFEAAVELLLDVGIYCQDTGKIIRIEKEEIEEALINACQSYEIGEKERTVSCAYRAPGESKRPVIIGGACGAPISEESYLDIMMSYAKEDIDALHTGALQSYMGKRVKINSPVEIMASRQEGLFTREAVRKTGKDGLGLMGVMTGVSSESQCLSDFNGGFRPCDVHLLTFPNDLKINWNILKKILHNHNLGNKLYGCYIFMLGGYSGGPEGTAITAVAEAIQTLIMAGSHSFACGTIVLGGNEKDPRSIWVSCLVPAAFQSAGYKLMVSGYAGASAGPCTEMICEELCANTIAFTASGFSIINGGIGNSGGVQDHTTGMESRIVVEVSRAAAGMGPEEADSIVTEILGNLKNENEEKKGVPKGKKFTECYDRDLNPSAEYVDIWENKKRDLHNLGLKG